MKLEPGNRVELLTGGAEYFPALLDAIANAREEIYLETYIYHDDDTGRRVTDALVAAARRGVQVRLSVDGFGSANLATPLKAALEEAGAEVVVFRPYHTIWRSGLRWFSRKSLRRLHRKLVLVDRKVAFCGGINILDDLHDPNHGPLEFPRFDFAARIEGPLIGEIGAYVLNQWLRLDWRRIATKRGELQEAIEDWVSRREWAEPCPDGPTVRAAFVTRDNFRNRRAIENAYLVAIRLARKEVILCNAYYFPGRRFRKRLAQAARRGVRVRLLLQGQPEYPVQHYASQTLYAELIAAGIEIHEYARGFLHAKVGVVDGTWSTVGSSNIDPFSLFLAREANIVVMDERFSGQLREKLETVFADDARPVNAEHLAKTGPIARAMNAIAYAALRLAVYISGNANQY